MIPSRQEWATSSVFRDNAISALTNDSKTETATDSGIFSDDLDISASQLSNICTDSVPFYTSL